MKQRQFGPDLVYPEEATEAEVARCSGRASGASWANPRGPHPPAHGERRQRLCGAGVRPGRHGRLGGTATGTTRDPRHGGEGCGGVLLGLLGGLLLPPCAGEVGRSAGNNSPMMLRQNDSQAHGNTGGRGTHTGDRRGNALLAAPEEAGEPAATCESAWRKRAAGGRSLVQRHPTPGSLPPWLSGATDDNQGENTGTGGGPRQRQRTRTRAAGNCQQHPRQRQLFRFSQRSNNGAASGTCNRPGIAQFHGTAFTRRNPRFPISAAPRQANVR